MFCAFCIGGATDRTSSVKPFLVEVLSVSVHKKLHKTVMNVHAFSDLLEKGGSGNVKFLIIIWNLGEHYMQYIVLLFCLFFLLLRLTFSVDVLLK